MNQLSHQNTCQSCPKLLYVSVMVEIVTSQRLFWKPKNFRRVISPVTYVTMGEGCAGNTRHSFRMKFTSVTCAVAGCSAWNAVPAVRQPSCSPRWWCVHVTSCSTCTASRARCATRPSARVTSSAWKTALCCARSITSWPYQSSSSSSSRPHQLPSLGAEVEAALTRLRFHPPNFTPIIIRRPPRRCAPTARSAPKCPTLTARLRGPRDRRGGPGNGNRKTWRPWLQT